jgi:hypothetical protein
VMRRTPAEFYVKYRLLAERDRPIADVTRDLVEELVFVPHEGYAERLRERMQLPQNFRPTDLGHRPSQDLLRREHIWSMYFPHRGTREALALFQDVQPRMAVQLLIAGSVDEDIIVKVASEHLGVPFSGAGLREFKHYFWNTRLLSRIELAEYVRTFFKDEEMARIAVLPPEPMTAARAMVAIGAKPPTMDEREALESQLAACTMLGAVYVRDLHPGPSQANALRSIAETTAMLREAVTEIARSFGGGGDVIHLAAGSRST